MFKTQISFGIKSEIIELGVITKELGLDPDRFLNKGDMFVSKHSGSVGYRDSNLWAIDTKWTVLEEETVSHHIEYLKSILTPKEEILKRYKADDRFELSFWIWIETDYGAIGLYLTENELSFLNDFSNYIHYSFLTVETIKEK